MNSQLSLFISTPTAPEERARHKRQQARQARTINDALSQMRALHEEINRLLYTASERPTIKSPADAAALVQYEMATLDTKNYLSSC